VHRSPADHSPPWDPRPGEPPAGERSATFAAALSARLPPLISPEQEARAFWRMRWRLVSTLLAQAFSGARFRMSTIALLSIGLWAALFGLFFEGFQFLENAIPDPYLHDQTLRKIFGMFFVTLMVMLVFSTAIILYSSLFKAADVALLLTLPGRAERVFLNKFQEALLMSSWAFILLGSPMLVAYGIVVPAPWHYYAMLVPFLVAFVYVPAALGALACLVIVHRLPQRPSQVLSAACVAGLALALWLLWSLTRGTQSNLLTPGWFEEMLSRLRIAENRLLPSWWLSTGLLESAQRDVRLVADSVLFLALLIANALFLRQVALWTAARIYRPAYRRLHGRYFARRRTTATPIDRVLLHLTRFLSPQIRLLIVKDFRLFRRDPMQWSQFLIFTGLLVLYFFNIRSFSYDITYASWVNVVSFLNVSVVGLLLSTFTTRFIFPMISLEGRRFWLLGLLPLRRRTILWSKFAFAVGASLVPSSLLILLSDAILRVDGTILACHQLTCVVLCLGLSGIAVGLGAKMPNLREQSPARIAAGFGGTLTLVASTLYILAVVALTAIPCHFYVAGSPPHLSEVFGVSIRFFEWVRVWFFAGIAGSILLGIVATVTPLVIGFRAFDRLEL